MNILLLMFVLIIRLIINYRWTINSSSPSSLSSVVWIWWIAACFSSTFGKNMIWIGRSYLCNIPTISTSSSSIIAPKKNGKPTTISLKNASPFNSQSKSKAWLSSPRVLASLFKAFILWNKYPSALPYLTKIIMTFYSSTITLSFSPNSS